MLIARTGSQILEPLHEEKKNKLNINFKKYVIDRKSPACELEIGDAKIKNVQAFKYLRSIFF